ncbi:uncharacterized protein LOC126772553 [Nymphalis io]|uniref:uncharacterized protein LOC126772553 n=1 Tax=Inachis io TaxID=171585 RepID=UPI0021688ABE|nr:uncharacterized protein LOC126772553 [Nymphalis io]
MIYYKLLVTFIDFERHLEAFAFYVFIKIISDRLDILNKYLANYSHVRRDCINVNNTYKANIKKNIFIESISSKNTKIKTLANTYNVISEAVYIINQIFEIQIFLTIVSTYIFIIITLWEAVYSSHTKKITRSLLSTILQCAAELISIGLMSYICDNMILKRNSTRIFVNELIMNYDLPQTIRYQAKSFMELITVRPLEINAFEMFTLNTKLMLKFVSVITTYLIVILQISNFL